MLAGRLPDPCALAAGEVHAWHADLDAFAGDQPHLETLLSVEEAARADRFATAVLRDRFLRRRGLLRLLLSRYLGKDPATLRFSSGPHGKPELTAGPHFNLSDSDNHVAIAIADRPVGIDIEVLRPLDGMAGIVADNFSAREIAAFAAVPRPAREEAFFRAWTRKEAFAKALGRGLLQRFADFSVEFAAGQAPRLIEISGAPEEAEAWTLRDLAPAAGLAGALAVRARSAVLRFEHIRP